MGLFGGKPKILSVDDYQFLQMTIKNILEAADYKVILAYSGEEAIEMAEKNKPDLILLDVAMPGKDGIATCFELKNNPKTSSIPIIMCTATSLGKEVDKAFNAGADGYIIKPIDPTRLKDKIVEILSK